MIIITTLNFKNCDKERSSPVESNLIIRADIIDNAMYLQNTDRSFTIQLQ